MDKNENNTYSGLTTSECKLGLDKDGNEICSSNSTKQILKKFINKENENISDDEIIKSAAEKIGIDKKCESCVITSKEFRNFAGDQTVDNELNTNFKPFGPRNNDNLLSNFNIDDVLEQWADVLDKWKNKYNKFYPFEFHMINFREHNKPLHTTDFEQLIKNYNCFACVLNTDKYGGPGKHWIAIFGDFRKLPNSNNGKPYVAFFNSSGNMPNFSIVQWMKKVKKETGCDIIDTTGIQHQFSKTECGPYCLYFIWKLLNETPIHWFSKNRINDDTVLQFRKYVFRTCK